MTEADLLRIVIAMGAAQLGVLVWLGKRQINRIDSLESRANKHETRISLLEHRRKRDAYT